MREALKKVRPDEFNDLVALNALYRPGAIDQIPVYAKGKHDPAAISYPDERLRAILEPSKGVILYQEQAMQIATEIAGFSGAKADDLRKAIGKKDRAAMAALKPEFIAGARASGTSASVIEFLWQTNERSADYSFNKSHAACYALIAYRTAWLKANYTAEYMAALISSVMSTKDKVPFFVARCEEMGIEILPPDVNLSDHKFRVEATPAREQAGERASSAFPDSAAPRAPEGGVGNIRFGLDAVKGVGYQAVEAIKRARAEGGEFVSLWDFCERVDSRMVNKKAIEALIKCGAFGSTGATRKGMLGILEQAQAAGQKVQQDALIGQGSIFDLGAELASATEGPPPAGQLRRHAEGGRPDPGRQGSGAGPSANGLARPSHPPIPTEEFDQSELLAAEKEAIGLFVSTHPLKPLRRALQARVDCQLASLEDRRDKDLVTVGGIIVEAKRIRTRNGEPMMFATLDDLEGTVELLVFGKALSEHEASLKLDEVVLVKGRVDHKEAGKTCLVVQSVESFAPSPAELERAQTAELPNVGRGLQQPLHLRVDAAGLAASAIEELKQAIAECPGSAEVLLDIDTASGTRRLRLGAAYRVQHTATLRARLEHALASAVSAAATG
jgi:DNA polymerase-3 subunit alpha